MRPLNCFKFYKLKVITYDISGQGSLPGGWQANVVIKKLLLLQKVPNYIRVRGNINYKLAF